jgi:hypothetical protein
MSVGPWMTLSGLPLRRRNNSRPRVIRFVLAGAKGGDLGEFMRDLRRANWADFRANVGREGPSSSLLM